MKKIIPLLLAAWTLSLGGAGCESNSYSSAIKYVVRTDPLVLDKNLGDERVEPDRPGVLPLLTRKDLENPFNPMHLKAVALFKENKLRDPTLLQKKDRREMDRVLEYLFGTPARPLVRLDNPEMVEALKLQEEGLENGSRLYRIHCLHCHGVTGDGRGPTGRWVNPHPRDYRQGIFKFMSVDQTGGPKSPRRDDLFRVIHQGVEGTAMPSFALLPAAEIEDMVSYVIHLSIRGKVEYDSIKNLFSYDQEKDVLTLDSEPLEDQMTSYLQLVAKDWLESQGKDKAIAVGPYPYDDKDVKQLKNSILRGYRLFKGEGVDKPGEATVSKEEAKAANCISCHTAFGRQALYKFDDWGTLTKPRDLTQGTFRGGSRPVDIYYRIHSGISGSGMTSFGKVIAKTESLWDLVNFVKTMPYPAMRKSMGIFLD